MADGICHVCNGLGHWITRKDIACGACKGSGRKFWGWLLAGTR